MAIFNFRTLYIKIDHHRLKYLNWYDKINCVYCGYGNGLNYMQMIVEHTEKYWCGVKHKKDNNFIEPKHHQGFVKYGDKEGLNKKFD